MPIRLSFITAKDEAEGQAGARILLLKNEQAEALAKRTLCKLKLYALTKARHSLSVKNVSSKDPRRKSPARGNPLWRRRRNRPGNAQAKGPLGDDTLESGFPLDGWPTEGCNFARAVSREGNLSGPRTEGAKAGKSRAAFVRPARCPYVCAPKSR